MMWLPAELDAYLEQMSGLIHSEYQVLRRLLLSEDREVHMSRLAATASVTSLRHDCVELLPPRTPAA